MKQFFGSIELRTLLLCAFGLAAAGCHSNNNNTSGYGIEFVTLTDEPGDFAAYRVNVSSITLTRSDGAVVTALQTPETVDLTKLTNFSELWGAATVPNGTYTSATIVIDYTGAQIAVMINGRPVIATVVNAAGTGVLTNSITVVLDTNAAYQPTVLPTYATSAAQLLAIDFNLAASTVSIDTTTPVPTVTVRPYLTAAVAPADTKPIRVRGPLVNSNADLGTYSVYVRPFYDEASDLGRLSLFTTPTTVFAINGTVSTGTPGITQLSQSSTGASVTAAYTTFTPTATPNAAAGVFTALSVIAGSTLEDVYTQGMEGDVIARNGNVLTLQGSTLQIYNGSTTGATTYNATNSFVTVGAGTIVTADASPVQGLNYTDIAVGQHIFARGLYSLSGTTASLDATGSDTNTGSVRLVPTSLYGTFGAAAGGGFTMTLQSIDNWPVTDYTFAGNGTAAANDPTAAAFFVDSGALALPAFAPLDPVFVGGLFPPFGTAPPDFNATSVNTETSVQLAGQPATAGAAAITPPTCAQANTACVAASMQVSWTAGTAAPFAALSGAGMTVDLANAALASAVIRIGPESIDMRTLSASPPIVPTAIPAPVTATAASKGSVPVTLSPTFLPAYSYGNPLAVAPEGIHVLSSFAAFAAAAPAAITAAPALQFEARGTYDRATNTFYALTANVVL